MPEKPLVSQDPRYWKYWTDALFDADGNHTFPSPVARTVVLGAEFFMTQENGAASWAYDHGGSVPALESRVNAGTAVLCLNRLIPNGSTVTRIRALVTPGAARAGTNRMSMFAVRNDYNFASPGAATTSIVSAVYDNAGTSTQVLSSGTISVPIASDESTWIVAVRAGSTGASARDRLFGVEIAYTESGLSNQ
jgi:hypothetical protein